MPDWDTFSENNNEPKIFFFRPFWYGCYFGRFTPTDNSVCRPRAQEKWVREESLLPKNRSCSRFSREATDPKGNPLPAAEIV